MKGKLEASENGHQNTFPVGASSNAATFIFVIPQPNNIRLLHCDVQHHLET